MINKDMNPERARGFTPEDKEEKNQPAKAESVKHERKTLQPDGREDRMRDVYEENQAKTIDTLADLKDEEDGVRFELVELSKSMLEASAEDPQKAEQIAERIAEVNGFLEEIEKKRHDLKVQLEDANQKLEPLKGLSDTEIEEGLHDITFGGVTEDETEIALKPLQEVDHVPDEQAITDELDMKMRRKDREKKKKVTPPPLPKKKKPVVKKEVPPPLPLEILAEAELRRQELVPGAYDASRAENELTEDELEVEADGAETIELAPSMEVESGKSEWAPEDESADGLREAFVPGAIEASQAEYELTGDELEEVVPPDPETSANILNDEIDDLFKEADHINKEKQDATEVLPADSPAQAEAKDLGDETATREEVNELKTRLKEMYTKGFSQENLDRLMVQKGVDPDKLSVSALYRARVKMKSMFDSKLRMLLNIYSVKTAEITDIRKRIQTGKLRLEDPEGYKKLMRDQKKRLRK